MPLLFLHLHTCKCLITCWIHILKYCLRHNGSNIYMPKKYLSATLWETICTHFSHLRWIFAIFWHYKAATFAEWTPYSGITKLPPTATNKLLFSCQQSILSLFTFHNSATHTSLFYTTHSTILQRTNRQTYGQIHRAASPPLLFRGWIFLASVSIYFPFVGVYIYADTANLPLLLLTDCYSADNKQPLHC